jgi:uncharacterized protein YjbJ (UPF0337 family)
VSTSGRATPEVGRLGPRSEATSIRDAPEASHHVEDDMNWDEVKGNWMQLKGAVREKWGDLTDDDLDRIAGDREQFVGRLQERYGMMRDDAERNVDEFVRDQRADSY